MKFWDELYLFTAFSVPTFLIPFPVQLIALKSFMAVGSFFVVAVVVVC